MSDKLVIEPLASSFGATVTGVKLCDIDEDTFSELYGYWLEYALLIFPDQFLNNEEQVTFAKRFGDLEFDIAPISNVRKDGSVREEGESDDVIKTLKGNMGWHIDSTYMPVAAKGAVFTAEVVPTEGAQTGWADLSAAFEALDDSMKAKIADLSAYHSLYYSQANLGQTKGYGFNNQEPPLRPLVKIHPETKTPALVIGRHAYNIPGLEENESKALLDELLEFCCQEPRVYHHQWSPGDAVVWDNRCLLHRATPWDMRIPRVMYHSRIAGDPATEFAAP